ncbi:unnamed protein product [Rangifer tarandus platyrhynchus]|uniref:Uncharacterized protein n=1 Tax=Rangifer tarandus platyrhynchus TaxID=3082113 RepID=A0AC59YWD5_RANTA
MDRLVHLGDHGGDKCSASQHPERRGHAAPDSEYQRQLSKLAQVGKGGPWAHPARAVVGRASWGQPADAGQPVRQGSRDRGQRMSPRATRQKADKALYSGFRDSSVRPQELTLKTVPSARVSVLAFSLTMYQDPA